MAVQNVIILPASRHFEQTVDNIVPFSTLNRFLAPPLLKTLRNSVQSDGVATWGLTPGLKGQHRQKWVDLRSGDLAVFTGQGAAFATGTVIGKDHNPKFSRSLWGTGDDGMTWEYMIFLTEAQLLDPAVPYSDIAPILDYASNWVPLGAMLIRPPLSKSLAQKLGPALPSTRILQPPEASRDAEVSKNLEEMLELDAERTVKSRLEQQKIRSLLFGAASIGLCDLCGSEFPKELLIAAHIKRRSACSNEEKRDHARNILSLCRFGCDELFERGFVVVKNGRVADGPNPSVTDVVSRRVSFLRGKAVSKFNKGNAQYFDWHRQSHLASKYHEE